MISREEIESLIPFEGENVGWAHGPTNCRFCDKLVNDYWFVSENPVCESCMPPEDLAARRRSVAVCQLALWALYAREALEFYADKTNWTKGITGLGWAATLIQKDCALFNAGGGRARLALAKFPESK